MEGTTDGATHVICHIIKYSLSKRWVALRHFHNFVDGTYHFGSFLVRSSGSHYEFMTRDPGRKLGSNKQKRKLGLEVIQAPT
jgi:hypothetical protein